MRDSQEASQAAASKTQGAADSTAQPAANEYLTVAGKTQKTRQSTFLVIILFVVGLAVLGVMVRKCQPKAAAASPASAKNEDTQIEAAIARLTGVSAEMTTRMDQIVEKFHEFSAVVQVAVDELAKNPFELEAANSSATPSGTAPVTPEPLSPPTRVEVQVQTPAPAATPGETPEQAAAREAEKARLEAAKRLAAEEAQRKTAAENALQQYQQQVTRKATELKLQSILQSNTDARCLIDDTLVRVGGRIKGFQLTEISDNMVHLLWSEPPMPDVKIVLKLSE
jgi:hypothetical protein